MGLSYNCWGLDDLKENKVSFFFSRDRKVFSKEEIKDIEKVNCILRKIAIVWELQESQL